MKAFGKFLIILFIISLLLLLPPVVPGAAAIILGTSTVSGIYQLLEQYALMGIAAAFAVTLAYALARRHMGTHRGLYALYGLALIAVNYLSGNPLPPLYIRLAALAAIAAVDAAYVAAVWGRLRRISFLSMSIPAVYLVIAYPLYYLELAGFAVFVLSFSVMRRTVGDSVVSVNLDTVRRASGNKSAPSTRQPGSVIGNAAGGGKGRKARRLEAAAAASASQPAAPSPKPSPAQPPKRKQAEPPSNVPWPAQSDYARAMQNIAFSISASYPEMRSSKVVPNPYVKLAGNIVYSSGNYGTIFKLENGGSAQALKCFTRSKPDINGRYSSISKELKSLSRKKLAFVDFQYLPGAIRTFKEPSMFFPVLLMDWVEGSNLNTYVSEHLRSPESLKRMASSFLDEMVRIRKAGIAHGDIAGDNIVIGTAGGLTLVDYDGTYVPAFRGFKSQELGHDNFQHPARGSDDFSERLDNFSILVTYLSLLAVAGDQSLWGKYNKGDQDCLIFRKADFQNPSQSTVLKELGRQKGKVRDLAALMEDSLRHPPLWSGCDPQQILKA